MAISTNIGETGHHGDAEPPSNDVSSFRRGLVDESPIVLP